MLHSVQHDRRQGTIIRIGSKNLFPRELHGKETKRVCIGISLSQGQEKIWMGAASKSLQYDTTYDEDYAYYR